MLTLTKKFIIVAIVFALLCFVSAETQVSAATPNAPLASAPEFLKNHPDLRGWIDDAGAFTIGGGYLYWAKCDNPPRSAAEDGSETTTAIGYLRRWPLAGGRVATLSDQAFCFTANWAADNTGLYYFTNGFIFRRLIASPYEAQHVMRAVAPRGALQFDDTFVYWLENTNFIIRAYKLAYYDPTDPRYDDNREFVGDAGPNSHNLILAGNYLYWIANGTLFNFAKDCATLCTRNTLVTAPNSNYLTNAELNGPFVGSWTFPVWASGATIQGRFCRPRPPVLLSCSTATEYTAPNVGGNAYQVGRLATNGTYLFWIENYQICAGLGCSPSPNGQLMRWPLNLSNDPEAIAGRNSGGAVYSIVNLDTMVQADRSFVYFDTTAGLARLRVDAPPVVPDFAITGVEVTQGIQNLGNSDVSLVYNKPTYVRVYGRKLNGPRANNVTATLGVDRNDGAPISITLRPLNGALAFPMPGGSDQSDRTQLNQSWIFEIPMGWVYQGNATLRATVNADRVRYEDNQANNRMTTTINFANKAPICIVFIKVRTANTAQLFTPNHWFAIEMAKRLLPTSDIWTYSQSEDVAELEARFGIPPWKYGPYEMNEDSSKVLNSLWVRDQLSDDPDKCDVVDARTHYVGVVDPNENGNNGSGRSGGDQLWFRLPPTNFSADWQTDRAVTMAHELGHNYDRDHVNCPVGDPDDADGNYPFPVCQLDHDDAPNRHYGLTYNTQAGAFNLILPTTAGDLMSYAHKLSPKKPRWTSSYTWHGLINKIPNRPFKTEDDTGLATPKPLVQPAANVPKLADAHAVVLLTGVVHATQPEQSSLNHAWVFPTNAVSQRMVQKWQRSAAAKRSATAKPDAPYHVRLLDANGAVLDDRQITPVAETETNDPLKSFYLTFPAPTGAVARVVLLDGETVLASHAIGVNPPVISLTQPAGGQTIDREMTLAWTASDPDAGDRLLFTVQYSPDNGRTWRSLLTDVPNLTGTDSMTLPLRDLSGLPASTTGGLIRVGVSDGYNTTFAMSGSFTLTNRGPQPNILSPTPNQPLEAGAAAVLQGTAMDAEDGAITDAGLNWTVQGANISPMTGQGSSLTVSGLGPGVYDVSLTARDSQANTATATSQFTIAPLTIPATAAPVMDGVCDDDAYLGAARLPLKPFADGTQATVFLIRTNTHLWACFSNLKRTGGNSSATFAVLRADPNHSRNTTPQADDFEFFLYEDGAPVSQRGNGAAFVRPGPGGVDGGVSADATTWNAEMRIDASVLGGWGRTIGLNVDQASVNSLGDDYHWPYQSLWHNPRTWATTTLGAPPSLTSVTPNSVIRYSSDLTLTVDGANFVDGATVQWNGAAKATTFVSANQLQATIDAADLATAGQAQVRVVSPGGGLVSNTMYVTVNNPTPVITNATLTGNSLTVTGSQFVEGASLAWNGVPQPTTVVDDTTLRATIEAGLIPTAGVITLVVANPAPSEAVSNVWSLTIGAGDPVIHRVYLPLLNRNAVATAAPLVVYGDNLASGWENWSWDSSIQFDNPSPTHSGSRSIAVSYRAAWAGLSLRAPSLVQTNAYRAISFWVYGGGSGGTQLEFYIQTSDEGDPSPVVEVTAPAGVWTRFTIPLSSVGSPGAIARLTWQDRTGAPQPTFYLDDIQLSPSQN